MAKAKATPTSIALTAADRKIICKWQRENTIKGKRPTRSAAVRALIRKAVAQVKVLSAPVSEEEMNMAWRPANRSEPMSCLFNRVIAARTAAACHADVLLELANGEEADRAK